MADDAGSAEPRPNRVRFRARRMGARGSSNPTPTGRGGCECTHPRPEAPLRCQRRTMATYRSDDLEQRRVELTRSRPGLSENRADSDRRILPFTRGAVDFSDHPGLFMVPLDRPRAMSAAVKTLEPLTQRQPGRARVAPNDRHKGGFHRYCAGCVQETEHVAWAVDGRGSIPSIRWPAAEPAAGTTICLNCGQCRTATLQPRPPAWSSWPRSRIATRSLAVAADSADTADERVSETTAENGGMPAKRDPRRPIHDRIGLPSLVAPRAESRPRHGYRHLGRVPGSTSHGRSPAWPVKSVPSRLPHP
jgi:hypothetical protein